MPRIPIIEGPYLRDILDQPRALRDTLDGLASSPAAEGLRTRLQSGDFDRIVLTGMGSSFHALHPLHLALGVAGWTPLMLETSELLHYHAHFLVPRTLVIAVSQSGRSAEIVRLTEVNRRRAAILGVTNTEHSPLARDSDAAVVTRAGEEFSVSCKTYVATLLALAWLDAFLCERDSEAVRGELQCAPAAVASYLDGWPDKVDSFAESLRNTRRLFLIGRGSSLAAVGTGALIIKESDHFHAEGMSSAAFRHGPFEMLDRESFALVFGGDRRTRSLNDALMKDIKAQNAGCAMISEDAIDPAFRLPDVPPRLRPILEILPVQMMTLALAALANREAGRFERASKVTTVE